MNWHALIEGLAIYLSGWLILRCFLVAWLIHDDKRIARDLNEYARRLQGRP